ncbi:MAG: hypothetical protein OHK93_006976 [Ramalina farinacea]|uniref:Uncharacterized protein n=1 Tax=Ramalina farinacea TaxID=258253 RepID=A0AA43QJM0_9LECA|nr:hypothetical protein [Ramalina farinacea]
MTTLVPRGPYSQEELDRLYPKELKLQLVQIVRMKFSHLVPHFALPAPLTVQNTRDPSHLHPADPPSPPTHQLLRHGERSPVSARFQNAGLAPFWPYCHAARHLTSTILTTASPPPSDPTVFSPLPWRRRLETFGSHDASVLATGPSSSSSSSSSASHQQQQHGNICNLGELTDTGRLTTLALGQRLRRLYVDQLSYMPSAIPDADMIYLRATPMPRALESVQQAFWGLYPPSFRRSRGDEFPPPTVITRAPADETLFPNEANCRRFSQLMKAFGVRAAQRWNGSEEMEYLSGRIGKWMPEEMAGEVKVDGHPRLSGVMDTVNSTLAHGKATRLPGEFYEERVRRIIDMIGVEEWFAGYKESREYRQLGIGSLAGDVVARMVGRVERRGNDGVLEVGGAEGELGEGRGLGAFEGESWPPYTSHVAVELFKAEDREKVGGGQLDVAATATTAGEQQQMKPKRSSGMMAKLFGSGGSEAQIATEEGIARRPVSELSPSEKQKLDGFFVRVRYNDRPIIVPGCRPPGKHWQGDESFCTLEAFKSIVDKFTPRNWKSACVANLDQPTIPDEIEAPGYE